MYKRQRLLDEPFSAMDTYLREGLRLELSKVLADYYGVSVMVTHDRDEAFQLCKNIMLLDRGHVLIAGESRKIFQDPVTCKAARLTGCKNISKIERTGESVSYTHLDVYKRQGYSRPGTL